MTLQVKKQYVLYIVHSNDLRVFEKNK